MWVSFSGIVGYIAASSRSRGTHSCPVIWSDGRALRVAVTGLLTGVTSTAVPGVTGMGMFDATLTHYRASLFGRWISYSASVEGPLSIVI